MFFQELPNEIIHEIINADSSGQVYWNLTQTCKMYKNFRGKCYSDLYYEYWSDPVAEKIWEVQNVYNKCTEWLIYDKIINRIKQELLTDPPTTELIDIDDWTCCLIEIFKGIDNTSSKMINCWYNNTDNCSQISNIIREYLLRSK